MPVSFVTALLMLVIMASAAIEGYAQPKPIRSGDGWAIHAQSVPEDWTRLVERGNLLAGKLVSPQPLPNDHNTGSELKHLTDGGLAGADGRMWSDKRAMGWAYQPYARLTFDLEKSQPIGQVVLRLQVISQTSTLPKSIKVSLSDDGDNFTAVRELSVAGTDAERVWSAAVVTGTLSKEQAEGTESGHAMSNHATTNYEALPFDPPGIYAVVLDVGVQARFVQLDFALTGAMVTDEMAIVPATGEVTKIPPPQLVTTEYRNYVFDRRDQFRRMTAAGNLLLGREVKYSPAPQQFLNVDEHDSKQLTDGKFGEQTDEAIWFERGCVGWQNPPLVTIFADLGEVQSIDSVVMRLLGGATQNALEFPDEIKVLLSDDGERYYEAAARHKRGLDDLSTDAWSLPEVKIPWVHNFQLSVKQRARYVALQIAHKKQFIVSDEMAIVRGAAELPLFKPDAARRVELVTEGVAFIPVWGNVQPICENLPLRSRLQKQDARIGEAFDKPCRIVLDVPDTLKFMNAGIEPTEVKHEDRSFKRYLINWAGEGTDIYLQSLLPAGQTDVLFTSGDSGSGPQNERRIAWRSLFIPPARVPKRLHVSLSWADAPSLHKTWPNYLAAQRHLGFNGVGTFPCYWPKEAVPENQKILKEIRRQGFQLIQIESPAGALAPDRQQQETKSILPKGEFGDVCPAYRGQYYQKEHASFAEAAVWIEPDLLFYDIEAYWNGSVNVDRCERCLARFQSGKFGSWDEYRAAMGREIHVDMKTKIDKALADAGIQRKIVYGSYRTEPITPLNDGLFAFDDSVYPELLQLAMPSLYVAGNAQAVAESISANRARMKTNDIIPWLSTGCYGEYDPARTRDMILEAVANGSRGVTYYWYGHFDAAHFQSHAEAINIVASIEDIFMDGTPLTDLKCHDDKIKVCGMGLAPQPGSTASSELAVLVSNYQGVPRGTSVKIHTAAAAGTPVWDLHMSKNIGAIQPDGTLEIKLDDSAAHLYYVGRNYESAITQSAAK